MADPRFFDNHGPFSLGALAQAIGAELLGPSDASFEVIDVAPLENAVARHLSFFDNPRYRLHFTQSRAGACIVSQTNTHNLPLSAGMRLLIVKNAQIAYAKAATLFYPRATGAGRFEGLKLSLRGAHIHPSVKLGKGAVVDAGAVIAAGVEIGAQTHIAPDAIIGSGVVIGHDCIIGPQASITHSLIGDRVVVHPGARIGQDGFGFAPRAEGHLKVPQLGRVIIQDDVEIGANTTIDRGSGPDTVIGEGTKVDNLCQIAHNVKIGRGCFIVAQVGISGSVEIGDQVILAGQAATVGHVKIGDGAQIAARGGVTHDLAGGQAYGGYPARPLSEWKRELALVSRLSKKNGDSEKDE